MFFIQTCLTIVFIELGSTINCKRIVIEFGTRMVRAGLIPKEGLNKPTVIYF